MRVKLQATRNPDFYYIEQDIPPTKLVEVDSLTKAVEVCQDYIAVNNLGGGNWTGGQIFTDDNQVACVSYNGRVWDMDDNEIDI